MENQTGQLPDIEELLREKALLAEQVDRLELNNDELKTENDRLKRQMAAMQRQLYGKLSEKLSRLHPGQMALFDMADTTEAAIEQPAPVPKKKKPLSKPKRRKHLPEDLPVEKTELHPEGDLSQMERIGCEVTNVLEYEPGHFWISQTIRHKYKTSDGQILIPHLPERALPKSIAGAGLLADILVNKYVDHLPLYRQRQRYLRDGVNLSTSSMSDWVQGCGDLLAPIYDKIWERIHESGYVEVDETTIKVIEKQEDLKKRIFTGYYWVMYSPQTKDAYFHFEPGRSKKIPQDLFREYDGYLQSDGLNVYDDLSSDHNNIRPLNCMAHARRKFFNLAQDNPKARHVVEQMALLYRIEAKAREKCLSPPDRKKLRDEKAVPVLDELKKWMQKEYSNRPVKSAFRDALEYALKRWEKLCAYTKDGRLEIDNNLVENAIRPVAIGRKNYLFAGSKGAARRAGIFYTLFTNCKANGVDPYDWLCDVLDRIPTHPINRIEELLPQNWKKLQNNA